MPAASADDVAGTEFPGGEAIPEVASPDVPVGLADARCVTEFGEVGLALAAGEGSTVVDAPAEPSQPDSDVTKTPATIIRRVASTDPDAEPGVRRRGLPSEDSVTTGKPYAGSAIVRVFGRVGRLG